MVFARQGCHRHVCVDRSLAAAEETAEIIKGEGFPAMALAADVTSDAELQKAVADGHWQHMAALMCCTTMSGSPSLAVIR